MSTDVAQWGPQLSQAGVPEPPITKDEAYFAEMGLEFLDTREGLSLPELQDLFLKVGIVWCVRTVAPFLGVLCVQGLQSWLKKHCLYALLHVGSTCPCNKL